MSKFNWEEFEEVDASPEALANAPAPQVDQDEVSKLESFGLGALQGASFNFADEIEALARSSVSDDRSYEGLLEEIRKRYDTAATANPITSTAGELVGGIATPAPIAGAVLRGAKGADKVAKLAKLGASGGAIAGLGASSGDVSEQLKDATAGAAAGTILAPLLGAGVPALAAKAADVAQQGRLGRSVTRVFEGVKEASMKRQDEIKDAVKAGKSAEEIQAIADAPKFADRSYYKQEMDQFTRDTENYVKMYTDPKSVKSVPGYKNELYAQAAKAGEEAGVSAKVSDVLDPLASDTNVDSFTKVQDDLLEVIGSKKVVDESGATSKSTKKLQQKIQVEQKKVDAALRDEAATLAKKAIADSKKDPAAPYRALGDTWLESQRVKRNTKIANDTKREVESLSDMIKNPYKYSQDASPEDITRIVSDASSRLQSMVGAFKAVDLDEPSKLVAKAASDRISQANELISKSYKISPTTDPSTGRTVFVAQYTDEAGKLTTKPLPTKEDWTQLISGKPMTLDSLKGLTSDIYTMMKANIAEAAPIKVEKSAMGGKLLTAEVPGPKGTKVLSETVAPTESLPIKKVPAVEELDYQKMREVSNAVSEMIGSDKYPREVVKALMDIKNTLSSKSSSDENVRAALKRANDFIKLETEGGLQGLLSGQSIKDLNVLKRTDKPRAGVEVTQQGRNLRSKLISAAARDAGPEGADLNLVQDALKKAQDEFGLPSDLNQELTRLRARGQDIDLLTSLYDRQELPGGVESMFQRMGLSPTSWILHGSKVAGDIAGKAANVSRGTKMGNMASKIVSMSPEDYLAIADKVDSPLVKSYMKAMAGADGPKRKALLYVIMQNPAARDIMRSVIPGLEKDEE